MKYIHIYLYVKERNFLHLVYANNYFLEIEVISAEK